MYIFPLYNIIFSFRILGLGIKKLPRNPLFLGLEKGLAVYLKKALMDLLFLSSVLAQLGRLVWKYLDEIQLVFPLICHISILCGWLWWISYWDFIPTVSKRSPSNKNSRTGLIVGIVVPVGFLSFLSLLVVFCIVYTRWKKSHTENNEVLHVHVVCLISSVVNLCMLQSKSFLMVSERHILTLRLNLKVNHWIKLLHNYFLSIQTSSEAPCVKFDY